MAYVSLSLRLGRGKMKKIKIGQIGIGHNHGEAKIKVVRKFPELFEVTGYAEENEEWIAKRGNNPGYEGLKRLSVEQVIERSDAVLIECDVWNLTKYAKMCIDAGKHVHIDKPASGTLEEYRALLDSAKEQGLVVQLGYMYRYNPSVQELFRRVRSGELGSLHSVNAEMSTRHPDEYREWLRRFPGGNMFIFGSHLVDLIVSLLGEPKRVVSSIVNSGLRGVLSPDITSATLEYEGAIARVFVSSVECNGWGRRCLSVAGSEGTLEIRPLEVPVRMTLAKRGDGNEYFEDYAKPIETVSIPDNMRYDEMIRDFYAYIVGTRQNPYSYEHEYLVQKVLTDIVGGECFGE